MKILGFRCHGNTTKFSDWLNSRNQVFSLVKMTLLITLSLYGLSLQDFNHMRTLHIYTCHASHNFVEESSSIPYSTYSTIRIVSQLNEFHTIPSQIITTYNSQGIVLGIHFTSSKEPNNNMIFLFQKCDTFGRTEKGRTWLTSQDHTDFTQLI